MTTVLVPKRPGGTGGYQQLAAQDLESFKINEDDLDEEEEVEVVQAAHCPLEPIRRRLV